MKRLGFFVLVWIVVQALIVLPIYSQAANRTFYVSVDGSDENNGRSLESSFATLTKAFEMARETNIKSITIIGDCGEGEATNTGFAEIIVSGVSALNPEAVKKAMQKIDQLLKSPGGRDWNDPYDWIGCFEGEKNSVDRITISGQSNIRFENIIFSGEVFVENNATVAFGKNAALGRSLYVRKGATASMDNNSQIIGIYFSMSSSAAVENSGTFTMKDNSLVTKNQFRGVANYGIFTMQNNASVSENLICGVISAGEFTMKDNSSVSGNTANGEDAYADESKGGGINGGGIFISTGKFTMQGSASVTNNKAKNQGGGICVIGNAECFIKDNASISNNTAKQGGGIYFTGNTSLPKPATHEVGRPTYSSGKKTELEITGNVIITKNTASEGGGIYALNGCVVVTSTADSNNVDKLLYAVYGLRLKGGTVSENKADYGAGIYARNVMFASILSAAPEKMGGILPIIRISESGNHMNIPAVSFENGKIVNNNAEFVGGGVYMHASGAFDNSKTKGSISGNKAGDGEGEDIFKQQ